MDKSDSRLHCEQIEKLMAAQKYKDAAFLADKVDWRKEEDNKHLIQAAEVYRKNRRYNDAVNLLKMAHNRRPNNKKIVFLLCEVYFENKDVVTAQVYFDRYQSMSDKSDWHYDALKYKRALAYDLPIPEKIDILLELKAKEPAAEQFRFELANLFHQARQYAECAAECDELLMLFGDDGNYAKKALELKKSCVELTDEQEKLLRKLSLGDTVSDRMTKNIQNVNLLNTMEMNKMELENKLAEEIQTFKSDETKASRKKPEFNTDSLKQTIPPSTQEIFYSDKTEDIKFTQEIGTYSNYTVKPNTSGDIREVLVEDDEDDDFEERKDGAPTAEGLLSDWNKIKARNTANMMKSIHQDVVERTGKIFEKSTTNDAKYYGSVTGELPGSIWKEVDIDEYEEEEPAVDEQTGSEEVSTEAGTPVVGDIQTANDSVIEENNEEITDETLNAEEYAEENVPEIEQPSDEFVSPEDIEENEENVLYESEEDAASYEEAEVIRETKEKTETYDVEPDEESISEEEEAASESDDDKVKDLSPEERKLFAPFLYSKKMRTQIVYALENITLAAYTGNVIITTDNNESGFSLAKTIVKFMKFADTNFAGAMSRIDAEKLNTKSMTEVLDKLNNAALVIERANKLSNNSLIKLTQGIYQEERGILLFLVDTKSEIKKLLNRQRTLNDFFNIRIDIIAMNEDTLVDYGFKYAASLGYSLSDGFANLAFHKRIREAQAGNHIVTIAEVREIIDEAIEIDNNNVFSILARKMSKKYRDEEGRIILCEKDFD